MAETPKLTIVIKTLKAQRHSLEVVLDQNVSDLKNQIETGLSLGKADAMKLIHHGKVLKDDQVLSSIGLKEGDFVVLMTTKKKKSAKPAATTTQPQPTQPPAATNASTQPSSTPANTSAPPASSNANANSSGAPLSGASALVPPAQVDDAVRNLTGMGFPESEVRAALAAAFNNPDRAVEYLINGIPENARQMQRPPQPQMPPTGAMPASGATGATGAAPPSSVPSGANAVSNILQTLLQNPNLLNMVLQEINSFRPQEYQAIMAGFNDSSNPQQALQRFAALMNDTEVLQRIVTVLLTAIASGGAPGGAPGGPGVQRIEVTQQDMEAVQRLSALTNLNQEEALRLYLRAGRNAEVAASIMFEAQANGLLGGPGGPGPASNANQPSGASNPSSDANDASSEPVQANNNNMEVEENNADANANNNGGDDANPDSGANSGDSTTS